MGAGEGGGKRERLLLWPHLAELTLHRLPLLQDQSTSAEFTLSTVPLLQGRRCSHKTHFTDEDIKVPNGEAKLLKATQLLRSGREVQTQVRTPRHGWREISVEGLRGPALRVPDQLCRKEEGKPASEGSESIWQGAYLSEVCSSSGKRGSSLPSFLPG